jgi:hypothetical protein
MLLNVEFVIHQQVLLMAKTFNQTSEVVNLKRRQRLIIVDYFLFDFSSDVLVIDAFFPVEVLKRDSFLYFSEVASVDVTGGVCRWQFLGEFARAETSFKLLLGLLTHFLLLFHISLLLV